MKAMRISDRGIALIKRHEGCDLNVYKDLNGNDTIGWGHKVKPGEVYTLITQKEADDLLAQDILQDAELPLSTLITNDRLLQCEYDAVCALVYNIGAGNFKTSTMRSAINSYNMIGASRCFLSWIFVGYTISSGLLRRRADEMSMFLGN